MRWGRPHAMFWCHLWVMGVNFHGTRVWVTHNLFDMCVIKSECFQISEICINHIIGYNFFFCVSEKNIVHNVMVVCTM